MVFDYGEVCTDDFIVEMLGERNVDSPIELTSTETRGNYLPNFVDDSESIILNGHTDKKYLEEALKTKDEKYKPIFIEAAGPREKIYFEPHKVKAAIVTCGGLCPGLNNVIRDITYTLRRYGVDEIIGISNGYKGFLREFNYPIVPLSRDVVRYIHREGGTILGSSRGYGDRTKDIVNRLEDKGINMLFTIGGDGTQKGALRIYEEAKRRGLKISVVGIPKTIDNDLSYVRKSFGFETAVEEAAKAVLSATTEARSAPNGVGLVKLMGRESGFIAAHTAIAAKNVAFVLVPEVPFELEGKNGFLESLRKKVLDPKYGYAVVVVAEGAGQDLLKKSSEGKEEQLDASGNKKLDDIGTFLRDKIMKYFADKETDLNMKYIDPSYMIRSQPANANDSIHCSLLAANAVHAAMAGKTGILLGIVHNYYVHVPIEMAVKSRNTLPPNSTIWRAVLELTGQPPLMKQDAVKCNC
jgi:6-phosphofructokinase 1